MHFPMSTFSWWCDRKGEINSTRSGLRRVGRRARVLFLSVLARGALCFKPAACGPAMEWLSSQWESRDREALPWNRRRAHWMLATVLWQVFFFFWPGPCLKTLLILLQFCFCFMFWLFGHKAWGWDFSSPTRQWACTPALEGKAVTTGAQGKFRCVWFWVWWDQWGTSGRSLGQKKQATFWIWGLSCLGSPVTWDTALEC